ncbi:HDOD domain-containing protein [Thalassotalea sp. G2M2-11]|uniref:EAL and HDOD domain-containing protein n=1 Tax=Thalassotalea sp. G2M2-11 TaxID=2787627 RepID=UPI0019D10068|nr:HDOD domain-containing protein [Thalassotalea sp. G2M2-11]
MHSYVARQAILDSRKNLVAYELLFRDGKSNSFPDIDPNQATSNILTDSQLTLGIEQVTGGATAYINFHSETLIKHFPSFLDPKKIVIEILEDVEVCQALITAVKTLKDRGYTIALDDFDFDEKWTPLFPYIDIIKIDVFNQSIISLSKTIRKLHRLDVTLLAEKVETAEQFAQLKMIGFTHFQGYFFARPEIIKQRRISSAKKAILDLLSHSSQTQLDFDAISATFSTDPGLTYKLLRFINSPTYGNNQEITSLKHALIYIGELELKKFIALLALSDLNEGKCSEIMRISLIRAKFCEIISLKRNDDENPPKAFLTGILSMIDGILDHDLEQVLAILPIHDEIKSALRNEKNYLNHYLALAKQCEQGQWQDCDNVAQQLELSTEFVFQAQQEAIAWTDGMLDV